PADAVPAGPRHRQSPRHHEQSSGSRLRRPRATTAAALGGGARQRHPAAAVSQHDKRGAGLRDRTDSGSGVGPESRVRSCDQATATGTRVLMSPIPNAVAARPPARTGGSATTDPRPGLNSTRLVRLMRESVERCRLDLSGAIVFTEAASGPYAVTPVLAALAGAERVHALTRSSPYGTVEAIAEQTEALAQQAGVGGRISVVTEKRSDLIRRADIVTNSGHVRPLDAETIGWMKPTAVV